MHHAILGVGGVGGLIAAVLSNAGEDVSLVLRPEAMDVYPEQLDLESPFGNIHASVNRTVMLQSEVDVLWVAVKATQLDSSLQRIPPRTQIGTVVPLLNGVDHVRYLRKFFGHDTVVPATISVESERAAPGHIIQRSPFVRLNVASLGERRLRPAVEKLEAFGFECRFVPNEDTLLWNKLTFLAPLALASTASGLAVGELATNTQWRALWEACIREACAVATAIGAKVNVDAALAAISDLPPNMRSSMQKDVAGGRTPELDAIAGPIIRGGEAYGLSVIATRELVEKVQKRIATETQNVEEKA